MTITARTLASGSGWFVEHVICRAGPCDKPVEERHETVSLAAVLDGTFQYRCNAGAALLAPGAVLLGNAGSCFECGHEHGVGDRCVAFHFAPDYWERLVAAVDGARQTTFVGPRLPPASPLARLLAGIEATAAQPAACSSTLAETSTEDAMQEAMEETALEFGAAVLRAAGNLAEGHRAPATGETRRVSEAVRHIEAAAHDADGAELSLACLSRGAGMSPYHFLRTFRRLVGMSPHQYVLRTRMQRAAVALRTTDDSVSTIAFATGFNDLSTFNRRFRRIIGTSPTDYRGARDTARSGG